jgi:7-alpha-hydroxysteroid dehydrogenase
MRDVVEPRFAEMFRLDGQIAFVNGGGRGIGAASALALAEAGADVAIRSRTETDLQAVAERIRALGRRVFVAVADEGSDDVAALDEAAAALGGLSLLVNVAGGAPGRRFLDITDTDLLAAYESNVVTPLRLARAATPHLLAAGAGAIVNISTIAASVVSRGVLPYGTAKASLDHATRLMAAELAPKIRVNAVAPGVTLSETMATLVLTEEAQRQAVVDATPLRRMGEPADIATAVLYLCAPASRWVTGQVLRVDGGVQALPSMGRPIPDL